MTFLAVPLLTALLLACAFPPFDLHYLAFAALVPLLAATGRGSSGRRDLLLGWISGWAASTAVVWWVINTIVHYGHISPLLAVPILLLMTWGMGFFWGAFAWARGLILRNRPGLPDVIVSPLLWTALEYVRGNLPDLAFPWALLGYTQYRNLPLVQVADLFGVWAVSFIVVAVNGALALLAAGGPWGRRRALTKILHVVLSAALVAAAWLYGLSRLAEPEGGEGLRVAVVQGNIEQDVKWDPAYRSSTLELYAGLTRQAADGGARLVVWPETAAPFFYDREPSYSRRLAELASETGTPILFGAPATAGSGPAATLRNRAYLIDGRGNLAGWYDKLHLVPFGEYVPWRRALFFVDKLVEAVGEFSPGEGPVVLSIEEGRLGALICYEVIFPDQVRRLVGEGAELLVNITNDAWFGRTAASRQHFATLVFRAVENRRPIARAANTGVSGFVDSRGRILQASDLFVRGVYLEALRPSRERTLYGAAGDILPRACVLASLVVLAASWRKTGRRPSLSLP